MPIEIFKFPSEQDGSPSGRRGRGRPLRQSTGQAQGVSTLAKDDTDLSEMEDFAKEFEKSGVASDPFQLIRGFIRIASNRINKLRLENGPSEEIEAWQLERRTWALVEALYFYRAAPEKPPLKVYKTTSNTIAEEAFYRQHREAREILLVISWLQSTLPVHPGPELRGVKWQMTRAQAKQQNTAFSRTFGLGTKASVLVKTLDLDAPLRENASIHPEDAEFERALLRHIFDLLASGNFENAHEVCESTGNFTLIATMNGMVEYRDPVLDGVVLNPEERVARGTKRKALWRRMCLPLAKSSQVDKYERAIYGLLCGDLDSVLAVSDTWEAQLLAYAQQLAATQVEACLEADGRLAISNKDLLPFPQSQAKSIGDILNTLSRSNSETIRTQSEHPLRHIQGGIINNMVGQIIEDARIKVERIRDGVEDTNVLIDNSYLLRFFAHLILFLRRIGIEIGPEGDADAVLSYYIEDLTISNKGHLVPLYVSYLPEQAAIEAYSFLLADISNAQKRAEQFALAEKYGIDILNTLRRTIQRVFDDHEDEYPAIESHKEIDSSPASQIDERLSNSLLWFVDARMWDDVVSSANALYLRFLLSGKVSSAEQFHSQLQDSQLYEVLADFNDQADFSMTDEDSPNVDGIRSRSEFNEFDRIVHGFALIREWNAVYAEKPGTADRAWKIKAKDVVDRIKVPVIDLITTWMTENFSPERADAIHQLRVLYIPYLLFELHRILSEAKAVNKRYPLEALEMVNLVASEELDISKLLIESGRLDEYLVAVASISLIVGADSQNGVWRV